MVDVNQIKFKAGERLHFVTTRGFTLGPIGAVPSGVDIFFDGSTVEYAGSEYSIPQFRGAIKVGWAVLQENYDADDPNYGRPVSANIQVRHPTQGGNPMQPQQKMTIATTESDEREVGNVAAHAAQTKQANKGYQRGQPVNPQVGGVESQDGVPVRTLKTAAGERAKQSRTVLTAESASSAIRQASDVQIDPGQGITQEEMMERMSEPEREAYLASKEIHKSKYVEEAPAPKKVGQVKTAKSGQAEGMKFSTQVGGGIEIADPSGLGGKPTESVHVEDGISFKNTNGPTPKAQGVQAHPRSAEAQKPIMAKDGTADVRRRVAKAMCADFPDNYQFDQPLKKKLARLQADYEDRPDVIQAVFAAESDDVKAVLVQEFPAVFGG